MSTIGFLGAGAMSSAMAGGLVKSALFDELHFYDLNPSALEKAQQMSPKCKIAHSAEALLKCKVIVLGVKPQFAKAATKPLARKLTSSHLVVSIMGGVTLATMRRLVGPGPKLIRTMPNVPILVGRGATGVSPDTDCTPADIELITSLFNSIGQAVTVPESLLDSLTAVSGSGPSYVAVFMEALADAGVREGLPRATAIKLASATIEGAGALVASGKVSHPALLKDMVCSPAGTSIAGVAALEAHGMRNAVISAVAAAKERSVQLSVVCSWSLEKEKKK